MAHYDISRACRVLQVSRSVIYYQPIKDDKEVEECLLKKAKDHPTEDFWKTYVVINKSD